MLLLTETQSWLTLSSFFAKPSLNDSHTATSAVKAFLPFPECLNQLELKNLKLAYILNEVVCLARAQLQLIL